jgi:hypothetical protein
VPMCVMRRALFVAVQCLSARVGQAMVHLWLAPTVRPYSGSVEGGLRHVGVFRAGTGGVHWPRATALVSTADTWCATAAHIDPVLQDAPPVAHSCSPSDIAAAGGLSDAGPACAALSVCWRSGVYTLYFDESRQRLVTITIDLAALAREPAAAASDPAATLQYRGRVLATAGGARPTLATLEAELGPTFPLLSTELPGLGTVHELRYRGVSFIALPSALSAADVENQSASALPLGSEPASQPGGPVLSRSAQADRMILYAGHDPTAAWVRRPVEEVLYHGVAVAPVRCCVAYSPAIGASGGRGAVAASGPKVPVMRACLRCSAPGLNSGDQATTFHTLYFGSSTEDVLCALGPPDAVSGPSATSAKLLIHRRHGPPPESDSHRDATQACSSRRGASEHLRSGTLYLHEPRKSAPAPANMFGGHASVLLPCTWRYFRWGLDLLVRDATHRVVGWKLHANRPG